MTRETSRDYAHPHRPWPLRAANALLARTGPAVAWDPAGLVADAIRAEGKDDFGAPDVLGPLSVLCASVRDEARLHPIGARITRGRLVGVLRARLRAAARVAAEPSLATGPLPAPIVITGLQRTGTTLLHRLLAAVPGLRALRSWEGLDPVPPARAADHRRRDAVIAARALSWMAPDFFAVHPIDPDGYEEEILLLDHSLLSTVPEATLRVPTFSAWLEAQDQRPAYTLLRTLLRLVDPAASRWVLKTPHHLEWLDALLDVFPDAVVVHTHRDPVTTLGSFCSMVAHGQGIMSDHVDPHEIGRTWLRKTARMVDRALAVRAARGDRGFIDVRYDDLMADPVRVVAGILDAAGRPLTPDDRAAVERARRDSPQHGYGRHVYDLGDFGLTPADVAAAFADYRARFAPPP